MQLFFLSFLSLVVESESIVLEPVSAVDVINFNRCPSMLNACEIRRCLLFFLK